jgi:serine/threonine protein kinase
LLDETKQILKITDFGLANYVSPKDDNEESNSTINALLTTPCGTFTSIAPEVLKGEPYDERVNLIFFFDKISVFSCFFFLQKFLIL